MLKQEIYKISSTNSMLMNLIRITAAQGVLIGHILSFTGLTIFKDESHFPYIQNIGVVLLFLISGFLFAYSFQKKSEDEYTFKLFVIEKFARFQSVFFPALLFVSIVDGIVIQYSKVPYSYSSSYDFQTFIGNIFFLQDIPTSGVFVTSFGSGRPFWTLSVEWWIYMGAGFTILFLIPQCRKKSLNISHFLIAFVICYPAAKNLIGGRGGGLTFTWLVGMGAFFVHSNFAAKNIQRDRMKYQSLSILFFIGSVICGIFLKDAYSLPFLVCTSIALVFVMAFGSTFSKNKYIRGSKILSFFAGYTFSLYATHYTTIEFIRNFSSFKGTSLAITAFVSCNVIAIAFYYLFERHGRHFASFLKQIINNRYIFSR